MRRICALFLLVVAMGYESFLAYGQSATEATDQQQSSTSANGGKGPSSEQREKPIQPFRLDFSLDEIENGKVMNSRHYSLNLTVDSSDELKIGTRVPVVSAQTNAPSAEQFQYLDLGTNVWAAIKERAGELQLQVRTETSSTKHEDVDVYPRAPHTAFTPPIISQIKITGTTLLVTGKQIVVGRVDDPYSNRQFQLIVTVSKLR
jgi:hypothetical protein